MNERKRLMGCVWAGLAMLLLGPGASTPAFAKTFLVKDGKGQADIVISGQPLRMAKLAAEELQTYVEKISGAKLPITNSPGESAAVHIYVGKSAHTDHLKVTEEGLKYGAFRMVSGKNWLVLLGHDSDFTPPQPFHAGGRLEETSPVMVEWDKLTGTKWGFPHGNLFKEQNGELHIWEKDERGTFNAVTEFLRMQGVRWYLPDELGEIIPRKADILLPEINKTVKPDFAYRAPLQYGRMFGHAGTTRDEVMWQLRLGLNNGPDPIGEMEVSLAHGMRPLMERPAFKQAHPEYYALYGGQRDTEGGHPCLSSEGLFQENVRYVRAMFDLTHERMVSVMPEDGYGNLCQCDLCKGKDTPKQGWTGQISDYVWDYVNRVAKEVYKTHPDRKVQCFAYGAYLLPPTKIATLSPNLVVGICQWRSDLQDPVVRDQFRKLREDWLKKSPSNPLIIWDYYLHARPNMPYDGIPVFFPHLIAEDLHELQGKSMGEAIEVYRDPTVGIRSLAVDHLALYVTSRCWWDADLDVNALLEEYYTLYYGPAREEMKAFIGYAEANWPDMRKNADKLGQVFALLAKAQAKAPAGSAYARRIALIADYIQPLHALREQLAKGRKDAPRVRAYYREKPEVTLDGKLDEPFWEHMGNYSLSDLETGREPACFTSFKIGWADNNLYFGIRCQDRDTKNLNIGTAKNEDPNLWNGDAVEILLETQSHAYYQIALNPAGAVMDLDRKKDFDSLWSSGAQVATRVDDTGWTLEVRLPVLGEGQEQIDARNGIAGRMPIVTYPWFFNICRQRVRPAQTDTSAFSPTGTASFHDAMKFAELYVH
jgi:hypothetical protein